MLLGYQFIRAAIKFSHALLQHPTIQINIRL